MLDLIKHLNFFNPENINAPIHIIGLGAIGSNVAELLTRLGVSKLNIYDFDTVNLHNLTNQMFNYEDIGKKKTDGVERLCKAINPEIEIKKFDEGYTKQKISGYVFLCVDNIEVRKQICELNINNMFIKGIFDFRMGLKDAQHYYAKWNEQDQKEKFIASMNFTHEEAKENTPVSPCGTELSVTPTVRTIVSAGVSNFINIINNEKPTNMILVNPFANITIAQ